MLSMKFLWNVTTKKTCQTINPQEKHPKTFYAVNTVYVMKQGTHIQFQLVTMYYEGIKNTVNYFMLFLITCLLVTLDRIALTLIYSLQKRGTKLFLLLTGAKVHFFFSNPKNKPKKKISSLHSSFEIEHAGQNRGWTSRVSQQPYLATEHSYSDSSAPHYNPQAGPPRQRAITLGRRRALLTTAAPPRSGPRC